MISIGAFAFSDCSGLKSITIGLNLATIRECAFSGCSFLRVYIKDLSAWCKIDFELNVGSYHFYSNPLGGATLYLNNNEITSLVIPNNITEIKPCAFIGYKGTEILIPNSLTSIGAYAFYSCSRLTSINIPNSVTSIGDYAFCGCNGLTSVKIGSGMISIGHHVFTDCSGLTNIIIPDSVTSIEDYAFYRCIGLKNIEIPDSVTSIDSYAFKGCNKLIQKEGNVHYVDQWAIDCDSSATEVTLRVGTKGITNSAFSGRTKLKSVTIPESVMCIGRYAFSGCTGITSITIPESVTYIGQYAFRNCPLESVTVQGSANWQVSKTSDFANAETLNAADSADYVEYFTFKYAEYFWKRSK